MAQEHCEVLPCNRSKARNFLKPDFAGPKIRIFCGQENKRTLLVAGSALGISQLRDCGHEAAMSTNVKEARQTGLNATGGHAALLWAFPETGIKNISVYGIG
jgi:hypothetical protein